VTLERAIRRAPADWQEQAEVFGVQSAGSQPKGRAAVAIKFQSGVNGFVERPNRIQSIRLAKRQYVRRFAFRTIILEMAHTSRLRFRPSWSKVS